MLSALTTLAFTKITYTTNMYNELRIQAKKKVEAKKAFYICTIVFAFTTLILLILSLAIPSITFWLMLPIPAMLMVLCVLYFSAFGLPGSGARSANWEEEEIEKEMLQLYRQKRAQLPPLEELSENEILELKELEELRKKWEWGEDVV